MSKLSIPRLARRQAFPGYPNPKDGKLGRDVNGNLNGLIYENASRPFFDALPSRTLDELREFARKGAADALSKGLTCVHTEDLRSAGSVENLLNIYRGWGEEKCFFSYPRHLPCYHPFLDQFREAGWKGGDGDSSIGFLVRSKFLPTAPWAEGRLFFPVPMPMIPLPGDLLSIPGKSWRSGYDGTVCRDGCGHSCDR